MLGMTSITVVARTFLDFECRIVFIDILENNVAHTGGSLLWRLHRISTGCSVCLGFMNINIPSLSAELHFFVEQYSR